jgi:dsDNA-specific endonuclease/ATPase MutS2
MWFSMFFLCKKSSGEGILHQLVHKTLNEREEVHSFEIAPWESGGTGCTIVNL